MISSLSWLRSSYVHLASHEYETADHPRSFTLLSCHIQFLLNAGPGGRSVGPLIVYSGARPILRGIYKNSSRGEPA